MAFNAGGAVGSAPTGTETASAAGTLVSLTGAAATTPLGASPVAASDQQFAVGAQVRLAATEAVDTAAFVAWNTNAALAATEAKDTAEMNAINFAIVYLETTEAPDLASFSASNINVSFDLTEAPDVAAFNFAVTATMSMAATETPDSYSQNAYILWLTPDEPDDPSIWVPKNDPAPYLTTVI